MPAVLIERMTSTPSSQGTVMEPSAADKKRNKLGYHRTSVACVHCRRRKIRCLLAPDDAQGRCENCIRLRKECQFFPVDQQPPVEKKSRPNSRLETNSADLSTTSSSSPTVSSGPDQTEAFFPYQPIPLSSSQDMSGFSTGAFAGSPMPTFAPGSGEFAAAPPLDPGVPWDEYTTISDPQLLASMNAGKAQMMNMAPNVWSPGPNAMAPIPPNPALRRTPTVPSQPQPMSAPTYAMQPDGSVWQVPPARSMTFPAQPEMAPYPNPNQFPQQMHADLKRSMTSPVQPFPAPPGHPHSPPPADLQTTPIPVPVPVSYPGQSAPMGYPAWQDMNSMSPMNVVQYPMYTGDPTQPGAFGSPPPMGHPGQGHPPPNS